MTSAAQVLDQKHRVLEDREQELKIQFSSQEEDYKLLIKQNIFYKKQERQLREMLNKSKKEVE